MRWWSRICTRIPIGKKTLHYINWETSWVYRINQLSLNCHKYRRYECWVDSMILESVYPWRGKSLLSGLLEMEASILRDPSYFDRNQLLDLKLWSSCATYQVGIGQQSQLSQECSLCSAFSKVSLTALLKLKW